MPKAPDGTQAKCGARRRMGRGICQAFAMENGRCRNHGGATPVEARIVNGRRAVRYRSRLADKAEAYLADPEPKNLLAELAMARALFQDFSERFDGEREATVHDVEVLMNLLGEISKLVERVDKMQNRHVLTMAEVHYLMARVADILRRYVPDDNTARALGELESALALRAGGAGEADGD